jgi:hypothetical protein
LFNRKFWVDAGEAFAIAVAATVVVDAEALVAVGSREQLLAVGIGLGRAAIVAGLRAIAPRFIALRDSEG